MRGNQALGESSSISQAGDGQIEREKDPVSG